MQGLLRTVYVCLILARCYTTLIYTVCALYVGLWPVLRVCVCVRAPCFVSLEGCFFGHFGSLCFICEFFGCL